MQAGTLSRWITT